MKKKYEEICEQLDKIMGYTNLVIVSPKKTSCKSDITTTVYVHILGNRPPI